MAESRRLQLEPATPLQKEKKPKECPPTLRFDLSLTKSTDSCYPEFSYKELVKNAEQSKREKKVEDPYDDDDDDDKLQEIARRLEEKYNPKHGRRKRKKMPFCEDYVDRGMGYDETDPFIDNEEAYDELVPSTLTTEFGGFYINKGDLEFKNISENDSIDAKIRKKRRKQKESGFDKDGKKRRRIAGDDEVPKRRGRKPAAVSTSALPKVKKRAQPTVADMLQQHKAQLQLQQQEKLQQIQLVPIVVERNVDNEINNEVLPSGPSVQSVSKICESIESVVKASGEEAISNGSAGLVTGSSDGEEAAVKPPIESIEAPRLPENLPPDLDILLAKLKEAAYNSEEGKCKFFSEEVNRMLLNVELKSQELTSAQRSIIYSHLASHLPCTKETLQKRAKKLRLDQEDNKLREPMQKLKGAIAELMPEMIDKYKATLDSTEFKEEDAIGDEDALCTDGESPDEDDKRALAPRKKFVWNDDIRHYLCDVVRIKLKCYEVSKTRIQSAEEYLKHFLASEVKRLWPPGWMRSMTLFKESREAHEHITNRQKKHLFLPKRTFNPAGPGLTDKTVNSIFNSAMISQESNNFEPASQTDRCVPSNLTFQYLSETDDRKNMAVATGSEEIRHAEYLKLLTYPINPAVIEGKFAALVSPPAEIKKNEQSVLSLSKPGSSVPSQSVGEQQHLGTSQPHTKQAGKVSDVNTFQEGSLASDMLARIISASLADFPYAGSVSTDTIAPKNQSVITSNASFLHSKDSRTASSKLLIDSFTSPKRIEDAKLLNVESRKPSQNAASQAHLSSASNMELSLSAQHKTKPSDIASSLLIKTKSITPESVKSPVNLKFKDVMVPQPRQFAEAFERTSDHSLSGRKATSKSHTVKGISSHVRGLSVSSANTSVAFSNQLLNEPTASASVRTIENSQRLPHEFGTKLNTSSLTQGLSSAPYKKRNKYVQSSKNVEQWNHFVDTSLNASLLEGMKGFPFPVSTLPTPPPAHCSAALKTTTQLKDSPFSLHLPHSDRAGSLLAASTGLRLLKDSRGESANHSQQSHRLPVLEGSRHQSLIKGPWNTSPVSQASAASHSQFLGSSQASVANAKSTSPNMCSSTMHNATIVYAHSHSTPPPEKSSSFSHNQIQLSSKSTTSQVQGHSSRTSPSNVHLTHISQSFLAPQPSHSVSGHQAPAHSRSSTSYVHTHPSTSANALAVTFTLSQEQKADPRTN